MPERNKKRALITVGEFLGVFPGRMFSVKQIMKQVWLPLTFQARAINTARTWQLASCPPKYQHNISFKSKKNTIIYGFILALIYRTPFNSVTAPARSPLWSSFTRQDNSCLRISQAHYLSFHSTMRQHWLIVNRWTLDVHRTTVNLSGKLESPSGIGSEDRRDQSVFCIIC